MAQIVGGGPPVNESERAVIAHLRDHSPDEWLVLHNVEVPHRQQTFEIDLIVITPHAIHLIDVKGVRGRVTVSGSRWLPEGRESYGSPVRKLRHHARVVKGLLQRKQSRLGRLYVDALVVLTAPQVTLLDPDDRDAPHVVRMSELVNELSDPDRVPDDFHPDTTADHELILRTLHGVVQRPTGPRRFGNWEVRERLGGTDEVTDYRAVNATARAASETVLLRVYNADPFLSDAELTVQRRKIENAYAALCRMPPHPCIIGRRDFFAVEDESRFVLVLDDVHGRALQLHLSTPQLVLSTDAKLRVILDILRGLAHAHAHKVVHRALTPTAVLVLESGGALLTGFDYARPDGPRDYTVSNELAEQLDEHYVAPECQGRPALMSPASDVYAAGIIAYRLLTGELPFASSTDQYSKGSVLPADELAAAGVQTELIELLTRMCARAPSQRPAASDALQQLRRIMGGPVPRPRSAPAVENEPNYRDLPQNYQLTPKYTVRRRLGKPGTFGVAYQVYDDFASADRVVKIVLKDRESVVERLKQEYQILVDLPPHPNVVKVEAADYLNATKVPYLAFEYVEGHDVGELISRRQLGPADAVKLAIDVARGLVFLHERGIYHCDIKPSNLIWTDRGCKIIDFNVAVSSEHSLSRAGGTVRYQPPDAGGRSAVTAADLVDRDLYALGVTFYQTLTGAYPWDSPQPPVGRTPIDPKRRSGIDDLSDALVSVVAKAISPHRSDRFTSAEQLLTALEAIGAVRRLARTPAPIPEPVPSATNVNPFVEHLQTLYSQSTRSNAGTRGLDPYKIYVETGLDRHLLPGLLASRHQLVIITGNAGDGKTAFLENLVEEAVKRGADPVGHRVNGADFRVNGRWFHTNHDGSQDEGDTTNDDVLIDFFTPYGGDDESVWPDDQTRLIAINQGRLTDFLRTHAERFPRLAVLIDKGDPDGPVTVVNLNQRSVVANLDAASESVLDRMVRKMTDPHVWEACNGCELAATCYAPHNARTFAHPTAGPRVRARLRELFTLVHLRGRLHITLRDVGSALAYMLTSGRDCAQIHRLYAEGTTQEILDGFYFNSWLGPEGGRDRLLVELREVDVAAAADPALDRRLDYVGPDGGQALVTIDQRGGYDQVLLRRVFEELPRTPAPDPAQMVAHRRYLASARRRFYFECVDDDRAAAMQPYRSARRFGELLLSGRSETAAGVFETELEGIVEAINRSEGLPDPTLLGDVLALQIRHVRHGTIRSYRLFPRRNLSLAAVGGSTSPHVEGDPDALVLQHDGLGGHQAQLHIRLDLFEMLDRLRRGHLPGVAELQGLYLGLTIFKNELAATPYHEVLLTVTGRDLHRVRRGDEGRLVMERVTIHEDGVDGARP